MNYWILQSNPDSFRILDWLRDFNWLGDSNLIDCWHISQHKEKVKLRDIAFIWKSKGIKSAVAGIYAKAVVVPNPQKFPLVEKETDYFVGEAGRAEAKRLDNPEKLKTIAIKYTGMYLDKPLLSEVMERMSDLKGMTIFSNSRQEIQRVEREQGGIIESMLG